MSSAKQAAGNAGPDVLSGDRIEIVGTDGDSVIVRTGVTRLGHDRRVIPVRLYSRGDDVLGLDGLVRSDQLGDLLTETTRDRERPVLPRHADVCSISGQKQF